MTQVEFVCRLCLSNPPSVHIFNKDYSILNKIHLFCKLQINENDGLPDHICSNCSKTLDIIFNFKVKCEESDKILRNKLLIDLSNVKNELEAFEEEVGYNDNHKLLKIELKEEQCTYFKSESSEAADSDNLIIDNYYNESIIKNVSIKTKLKNESNTIKRRKTKKKLHSSNLCPICGKLFFKLNTLNSHIETHSIREKLFKCPVCSKDFAKKWTLKEHQKIHVDVKIYPCPTCGKTFKTSGDAARHTKVVHNKSRAADCELCGKQLATRFGLKMHMRVHTGEKTFQCDVCEQCFTFKHSLRLHMRIHTGEKPHVCRFCGSKFSALKTLKEHERIHTGETPYHCPSCSKAFSQLSNLKSHFKNNHKGVNFTYKYSRSKIVQV